MAIKRIIFAGIIILIGSTISIAGQQMQKQEKNIQPYNEKFYNSSLLQQGFNCYQRGDYEKAISCFKEVYKTDPNNKELRKALAGSYFQLGANAYRKNNLTRAKDNFFLSLKYYPLFEIYLNLTVVLIKLKEFTKAKEIAQAGLKIKPDSKELLLVLAECCQQEGNKEKLLEVFKQLYKYYPNDLEIALNLGSLYRINQQAPDAMNLYQALKKQFPTEKRIYEAIVEIQASGFKYKEARETYQELLKYYPEDTDILFKIAKFYAQEEKYEDARETYREILKLKKGDVDVYKEIAMTYEKQKDVEKAIDVFNKARGILPDNRMVLKELGRLYEARGSITQAEVTYKEMITLKQDEPYGYIKLGLLAEGEDNAAATGYFTKACKLKATNPLPYYKAAKEAKLITDSLYYTKLAIDKALREIAQIRTSLFMKFKGVGEGQIDFAQLAELSEESKQLDEPQKILKESITLLIELRGNDKKTLLADLKGVLDDYPYSAPILSETAKIYQDRKDYSLALTFWEKAVRENKEEKEPYLNMAVCYENMGNEDELDRVYRQIIVLDKTCQTAYEGLIRIYRKNGKLNELIDQWGKMSNVIDNPTMIKYLEEIKNEKEN